MIQQWLATSSKPYSVICNQLVVVPLRFIHLEKVYWYQKMDTAWQYGIVHKKTYFQVTAEFVLWICSLNTSFIHCKGDDVLVVVVYDSRKGARQARPHTDVTVRPLSCSEVLPKTHQAPGRESDLQSPMWSLWSPMSWALRELWYLTLPYVLSASSSVHPVLHSKSTFKKP